MVKRPDRNAREQRQLRRDYEARQALHAHRTRRRKRDNWVAVIAGVVVCAIAGFAQFSYFQWGPGAPAPTETPSAEESQTPEPLEVPDPSLAEGRLWTGELAINDVVLGIELDGVNAPQATAVLVDAADTGWYDGKYCPRVTTYATMQVLQCGTSDPASTASETGFAFGPIENAPADDVYPAGSIAMARVSGDGSSMAHQFFIVTADSTIPSDAAGGYTVVGHVTSGLADLIAQITSQGTADGSEDGAPATTVQLMGLTIG